MGARSKDKALAAIHEIQEKHSAADVHFLELDLSNFQSVINAAKKLREEETVLHGLINNAGIMGVPYSLTVDGYEAQFQVSFLFLSLSRFPRVQTRVIIILGIPTIKDMMLIA